MKAHKYRVASKADRTVDGITFDSKAEASRYGELKLLERAGVISNLELQPVFELQPAFIRNGKTERSISYRADFRYTENWNMVVEDVKGVRTEAYKIKRKLFLRHYPFVVFREVV